MAFEDTILSKRKLYTDTVVAISHLFTQGYFLGLTRYSHQDGIVTSTTNEILECNVRIVSPRLKLIGIGENQLPCILDLKLCRVVFVVLVS